MSWALRARAGVRPSSDAKLNGPDEPGGDLSLVLTVIDGFENGCWRAQLYAVGPQETKLKLLNKLSAMGVVSALLLVLAADLACNTEGTDADSDTIEIAFATLMAVVAVLSMAAVAQCTMFFNALDCSSSDDLSTTNFIVTYIAYIDAPEKILSLIILIFFVAIGLKMAALHGAGVVFWVTVGAAVLGMLPIGFQRAVGENGQNEHARIVARHAPSGNGFGL